MYFSFNDCDLKSTSDESMYKSDDSNEDEDKIDSDIETALYSQIHHQENPFYETTIEETENLEATDHSDDQHNDKNKHLDSALNKDNATPCTITISDESDIDDTSSSDVQFICETKGNLNNENEGETYNDVKNNRNKWWKDFVSSTYNDDDTGDKLLEDEKNSDDDSNYEKDKISSKLKHSVDLEATASVSLPRKNKRTKKSSQVKGSAIKCASKRRLSDSSEDSVFKHQQKTEGKDILINIKPSVVTVDLTKDDGLWQLCPRDMCKNRQESRYYNKKDRIICNNCSERGHMSRDCNMPRKLPVCYLCGKIGHQGRDCLNPACTVCLSVGHSRKHCQWRERLQCPWRDIRVEKCPICKMSDHLVEDCPDKWRRYHLTISPGPIIYGDSCRNSNVYCYNCARKGHFGHECDWERMDEDTYPTSPFISQYCEPVILYRGCTAIYNNVILTKRLIKLAKRKQVAVNRSNKLFKKKSKSLLCRTERILNLSLNSPSVKRKKPKKKKTLRKNTSTDKIDLSVASSSQMSNDICSPPKKKRKKKEKPLLNKTGSQQQSKVKKFKKKKDKLQNSNIKTGLTQGGSNIASNCETTSIAANILRSLMPSDLQFSMKCINLFSGKRS